MAQVDIVSLKDNADPARQLRLPIRDASGRHVGDLQCIDRSLLDEPGLIDDLTTWRNQWMPFFLTQFTATEERTRRWFETISLPAADQILFVICDPHGNRSAISASATFGPARRSSTTSSAAGRAISAT